MFMSSSVTIRTFKRKRTAAHQWPVFTEGKPEGFTLCKSAVMGFYIHGLMVPSMHCSFNYLWAGEGRSLTAGRSGMETLPPSTPVFLCVVLCWDGCWVGYCAREDRDSEGFAMHFLCVRACECVSELCMSCVGSVPTLLEYLSFVGLQKEWLTG